MDQKEDLDWLQMILAEFVAKTGSRVAQGLLDNWPVAAADFVKVLAKQCGMKVTCIKHFLRAMLKKWHVYILRTFIPFSLFYFFYY